MKCGVLCVAWLVLCAGSVDGAQVLYETGFGQQEGYNAERDLDGQKGWLGPVIEDDGNTGLLDGTAYIGFRPSGLGEDGFYVWQPLTPPPNPDTIPVVHFFAQTLIVDSLFETNRDWFGWTLINQSEQLFFTLVFNNEDLGIYYFLEDSDEAIYTGFTFENDVFYAVEIEMDFEHNQWTAIVGGETVVTNLPIAQLGTDLNLGHVDAEWAYFDPSAPGDNYMEFDDYRLVGIPASAQPDLTFVQRLANGRTVVRLTGESGYRYRLEASGDLITWSTVATMLAPASGIIDFTDTGASAFARRFYRARVLL